MPQRGGGGFGRGGRRGLAGGYGQGPGGTCICPSCGYQESHQPGTPCTSKSCPKCHTHLIRE